MNSLAAYLDNARRRLRHRFVARVAAVIVAAAFVLTLALAWLFVTLVPESIWVVFARVLMYGGLAAGIAFLVWRKISAKEAAAVLESRIPGFGGRLTTWRDSRERLDDSALLNLLAAETETVAAANPPRSTIRNREIVIPGAIAVLLIASLIAVMAGERPWQLAAQRLWTGNLFSAGAPRITVTPGDTVVPRGATVVIEATAEGFVARRMEMHAAFAGATAWEAAPMSRLGDNHYSFVFVGVTEEVDYYIGASGLSSERHQIHVADLPRVTAVRLDYRYPDWTGLEPAERETGDVVAVAGTDVEIIATTDRPIEDPLLVINGEAQGASAENATARGGFEVTQSGDWHLAVRHEGVLVQISDSFLIDVVPDKPPAVAFTWPGHDTQATSIEERTLRFTANDDFGVEKLSFHYSVNGGEFVAAELDMPQQDEAEYTLFLESLRVDSEGSQRPLRAGDLVSFYAAATDRANESKTALYFVDVRPFEKTYRQSQQSGAQGAGTGGAGELVQRQREILSATWNLINGDEDAEGAGSRADQAEVLAMLQQTLADQVSTLTERAQARRLGRDGEVGTFITELAAAVEDMRSAASRLQIQALQQAVTPEQQALQHLLAAQASVTEVDVTYANADMRGTAGRSLSELMDLEMDRERNRYETPQMPGTEPGSQTQEEEWQRLAELASRQEQLANRNPDEQQSLASRWQQERLRRELEQMREQLQERQRSASQQSRTSNQSELQNAIDELDRAQRAMDQSLERPQGDTAASQQATEAIRRAAEQLQRQTATDMMERLARAERSVESMLEDQQNTMDRLEALREGALRRDPGAGLQYDYTMESFAERKRRMQSDLADVRRELEAIGEAVDNKDVSRILREANDELAGENVSERLSSSADAFEYGLPLYAILNESLVERALERLAERLEGARRTLEASEPTSNSPLAEVRALRARLNRAGGDVDELRQLGRRTEELEYQLGAATGESIELDTATWREAYMERGTDEANSEQLAQLMKDRLDLIEAALQTQDTAPIRAQQPRDKERDSEAAARYFRELGRSNR